LIAASTRFKIVGVETTVVGVFLFLTFLLNQIGPSLGKWLPAIDSDLPIVGAALIFVGLETLSLARHLPRQRITNDETRLENMMGSGLEFHGDISNGKEQSSGAGTHRFNLKELMSYDIRLHGKWIILFEFFLASAVGAVLAAVYLFYPGISSLYRLQAIFWLGFSLNCLTVLLISVTLVKHGVAKEKGMILSSVEQSNLRKYAAMILLFLIVPYATAFLGLLAFGRTDRVVLKAAAH